MTQKTILCLVLIACLIILGLANALHAEIKLEGLEDQESLKSYLEKTVLEEHEASILDGARLAKFKTLFEKALKAKGYYDAQVTYEKGEDIIFNIDSGSVFTIEEMSIHGIEDEIPFELIQGEVLDAAIVLKEQTRILKKVASDYCFYKLSIKHEVVLDYNNQSAALTFIIEGKDNAVFGNTTFTGDHNIDGSYLYRFVSYNEGDCWNYQKIEDTKTKLLETGIVASINLNLPDELPEDGVVPLVYAIKERAPRKIRLGLNYNTIEGAGVSAEWKHNNFFGSGEVLSIKTRLSKLFQSLGLDFTKPFFLSDKQTLTASTELKHEETDAFDEVSLNIVASINRQITEHWSGDLGVALEITQITEDNSDEEIFGFVSLPGSLNFDNRDNVLDPHKGFKVSLGAEPFVDVLGQSDPFLKMRLSASTYFDLGTSKYDPVLAIRASAGSIIGSSTENIPATKRFYAGGGRSVRGFGYQEAGPVDEDGDPSGGKSLLETNAEIRVKMTDTIGGVAFVDGGAVYDTTVPDFGEKFYIGAGVGARYYTSFGPLRFDVAVPVNEKENLDQKFQIYISIGQAF